MSIENRGPQLNGVVCFFLALSTACMALRCYCRVVIVKSFGVDDWAAIIAWVFFALFCGFAIGGVRHGSGQHSANLPPAEIPVGLKWWWACEPVYVLSNMALKFSIAIFLLRIAVARVHRIIIWVTLGVIEIYGAVYFFLFVLQCIPSNYFWTQYTGATEGKCMDAQITVNATYAYSAVSCAADWTLAIIPIFIIWELKMNARTKVSVALILAFGAIASTATIVRIPYVHDLANKADFLYATTDVAIWSTSETGIGIIASSLATLRPLLRTFLRNKSSVGRSTKGSSPWPQASAPPRQGYVRSGSNSKLEEFALRTDLGEARVTTVVETDLNSHDHKNGHMGGHKGSARVMASQKRRWNNGENDWDKIYKDDEEALWDHSIVKTTVSSQISN